MFSNPNASTSVPYSQPPRRARKRVKPIARVTSYDYNVQYDLRRKQEVRNGRANQEGLFSSPIRIESYNVMEGEILMSIDKSQAYRDGQLHCFSFANGLGSMIPAGLKTALTTADSQAQKHAKTLVRFLIMERLTYVGIAVTGFDATHDRFQDMTQGFVATFGGLNTIVNTGSKEVRPGDWICVGLPQNFKWEDSPLMKAKTQEGIPLDKLLFATEVYSPHSDAEKIKDILDAFNYFAVANPAVIAQLSDSLMPNALRDIKQYSTPGVGLGAITVLGNGRAVGENLAPVPDPIQDAKMLRVITSIMHAHRRLVIGKALSFARVGESFDITLGGSNSM